MEQIEQLMAISRENPQFLDMLGGVNGPIKREIEKAEKFKALKVTFSITAFSV